MVKRSLEQLFSKHTEKSIIIIAGPNGSGKSTHAKELQSAYQFTYLNPDVPSLNPKKFIKKRNNLLESGVSFGLETTLSGQSINRFFEKSLSKNYRILLISIGWIARNYVLSV